MPTTSMISGVLHHEKSAIAAALNLIEDQRPERRAEIEQVLEGLENHQAAHVVGITGPPGVGKSTLTSVLIQQWRSRGKTVGVVAVDPSSKRSGGALLGDRARIRYDAADQGVFVRSMAAGEQLGGIARATQAAVQVMSAAFDVVVVESVGVGQSETDIEDIVDTTIFVVQPGSGDTLQFMKSGIMEIPDLLVVNKSDQDKLARRASLDLKGTLSYRDLKPGDWAPKVLRTSAINQEGITELIDQISEHAAYLTGRGLAEVRSEKGRRWALTSFARLVGEVGIEKAGGRSVLAKKLETLAGQPPHRASLRYLLSFS